MTRDSTRHRAHDRPRLVTTCVIADTLGVSPSTVRRLAHRGRIPAYIIGRQFRFDVTAVLRAVSPDHAADLHAEAPALHERKAA